MWKINIFLAIVWYTEIAPASGSQRNHPFFSEAHTLKQELHFPSMALGTWTFAGDSIWDDTSERESRSIIHAALDREIDLFDTSPNYGNDRSGTILGKALRGRSEAHIATKIKIEGNSRDSLRSSIEESLTLLQRETIDLMQIHWPGRSSDETLSALELFVDLLGEGKIGHIGANLWGI